MVYPIGLSPNIERDDVWNALRVLLTPWNWYGTKAREQVVQWFSHKFHGSCTLFTSGRSACTAILDAFGIGVGDEVIVQAFTCMVVPNAIRFSGATPVFVDIDETLNIDTKKLASTITKKTRAIIVQHTFGIPADMDEIMRIAKKYHCVVIEDCAHALGAIYKGRVLGTIGDAAFFSFGRDKCISSVFGGAAIVHDAVLAKRLNRKEEQCSYPSFLWIAQQLFHPVATAGILPLYRWGVGKLALFVFQKLRLLSFPVSRVEITGEKPRTYMERYPNALAMLLLPQLEKLESYTKTRQTVASYYEKKLFGNPAIRMVPASAGSVFLRFAVRVHDQKAVLGDAKKQGLILGTWYHHVIDPVGSDRAKAGYTVGSCPQAEKIAKEIVNLPTRISISQADEIITFCMTI